MRVKLSIRNSFLLLFLALVITVLINGCFSVKLISDYDEQVDKQITGLYKNINVYMQDLADRPEISGADSIAKTANFNEITLEIKSLKLRVVAKEKNDLQIQQIDLLLDSWAKIGELEKLHPTKEMILNAQSGLEIALTAILKLELMKKRG